jgi:hypothetical protein
MLLHDELAVIFKQHVESYLLALAVEPCEIPTVSVGGRSPRFGDSSQVTSDGNSTPSSRPSTKKTIKRTMFMASDAMKRERECSGAYEERRAPGKDSFPRLHPFLAPP